MNQLLVNTCKRLLLKPHQLQVGSVNCLLSTEQSKTFFNLNSKQIAEIRDTPIRVYETKFRQNYCPHYWTVKDYCYDRIWKAVNETSPKLLKSARKSVYGSSDDILTCFFLPLCKSADHMMTLIEFNCWFFLTDDYVGVENTKQAFDDLLDVVNGRKKPEKLNEIIVAGINQNIRQCYTDAQYKLFLDSLLLYLIDCGNEIECREKHFNTVEEMVEFRINLIGVLPYLHLSAYALEIDAKEFDDNQIFNRMKLLIRKHVIVNNDLYSMKKEFAERETVTPFNALLFAYSQLNSIERAVDKIFDLMVSYENEFFELRKAMCAQYPNRSELHQYMDCLEYFAGGFAFCSMFMPRYNNTYSLKDEVFKHRFTELIPEVERNAKLYNQLTLQ